ncbi:MAG: GIY-YIG nuclease family protein [Pseudomonadales bacterium]|nr:GIY-YIG nuclease family protein [Pseudomonadales bacterium]
MIKVDDGSYYTGISTDPQRRFIEHKTQKKGAKFFRGRSPEKIVYCEGEHDRSSASIREAVIKKLSRKEKQKLISGSSVSTRQLMAGFSDLLSEQQHRGPG